MEPWRPWLANGQTCEIITAKGAPGTAGPSRDWLSDSYTVATSIVSEQVDGHVDLAG